MKKLALIMLAVVSMALVSCGGGGIQPASPDILYKGDGSKLDGYLKVKEVSARVEGEYITATAILEVVKDIPEMSKTLINGEKRTYEYSHSSLSLFDKDMMILGDNIGNHLSFLNKKQGETITLSSTIKTDMPSSEAIKKVKFVLVTIDGLYR
jgi:hypothetical protein